MAAPSGSGDPRVNERNDALPTTTDPTSSVSDTELLRSLNQLSLSTQDSRSPSRASSTSPNPKVRALSRLDQLTIGSSPSPHLRNSSPRSPVPRSLHGSHSQSPSRSATPTLVRKSSATSLHSANGIASSRAPSRRSSSTLLSPAAARSPANGNPHSAVEFEVRPSKTEGSVARDHFMKELEAHHISDSAPKSDTLVILQDACYKHRYQRPFAGKGNLSTIVERPERLQAVYTGVAMAYVRLGERHQEGKIQITPDLDPTTLRVPFDIRKTDRRMSLHSPAVTNVHGAKWMEELAVLCGSAKSKLDAGTLELQRPDMDRGVGAKAPDPFHKGDLYLSPESLTAFEGALGATCEAVDAVFSDSPTKRAFVAVRPPGHHCDAHWPHGFCWLNNVQVGIMHGFMNHGLTHAAIIDFDLHHGDGSQDITWDHNHRKHWVKGNNAPWKKGSIGYFSLHDIQSFPCEDGDPEAVKKASLCIEDAFSQTIWNVHLQQWKDHADFWYQYRTRIMIVLEKARAFLRRETESHRAAGQEPKAAIFFSAGFDASEYESPGMQRHKVNVPTEFYARISRDVVRMSFEDGLSVDGRIVSCLEGGYSDRALYSGVLAHLSGLAGGDVRDTASGLSRSGSRRVSLSASPLSRRSTLSSSDSDARSKTPGFPYESSWWTTSELDRLDASRTAPFVQPRQVRDITPPTYCSPTQASNAKVSDLAKVRRSMSGLSNPSATQVITRAPSPPPPAVYWPTATVELSRLLIPSNAHVASISWEELKAEEVRIKKQYKEEARIKKEQKEQEEREKLIASGIPSEALNEATGVPSIRKSGRERKPVSYVEPEDPNKNRRRTVAGAAVLATEKATARGIVTSTDTKHSRQPSRRLSASSALSTVVSDAVAPPLATSPLPTMDPLDRSGTAQSVRPDSSLSVRTTTGALPVPKTRPTATRKDSTKAAAPNAKKTRVVAPKTSTANPKAKGKGSTVTGRASARSSKPSSPVRAHVDDTSARISTGEPSMASSTASPDSGNDLAGITNGMKKIKINVITKEMKEAREKVAKERSSASTTPIIEESKPFPATPKVEEHDLNAAPLPAERHYPRLDKSVVTTSSAPDQPQLSDPSTPSRENIVLSHQQTPIMAAPSTPAPMMPTGNTTEESHIFIPYQPEGATPHAIPQTAPTKWVTPNTIDTPAPFRGHNFTATSAIPFSPSKPYHAGSAIGKFSATPARQAPINRFVSEPAPAKVESSTDLGSGREMSTESSATEQTWNTAMENPGIPEQST
ncbi:putative histone deacetylase [Seiridium unicorne]|uniref:Histone deacetylase n=1 Tax=Seiridium unicorne TaxID=138068 RepID=A0ABR2UVH6_9PEZI